MSPDHSLCSIRHLGKLRVEGGARLLQASYCSVRVQLTQEHDAIPGVVGLNLLRKGEQGVVREGGRE